MRCQYCNETDHEPTAKCCHVCGTTLQIETHKTQVRFKEEVGSFSEGLARVRVNGKAGFIDKTGKIVIAPRFVDVGGFDVLSDDLRHGFSDGLVAAKIGNYPDFYEGFINHSGVFVIQPQRLLLTFFSEGLAIFSSLYDDDFKEGFMDKHGIEVIPAEYDYACPFSEGLAVVKKRNQHYVFIDKMGRVVLEKTKNIVFSWNEFIPRRAEFSSACNFREGLARVECFGKKGYIDKTGLFTSIRCDSLHDYSEGLAVFSVDNYTKCGYIDKTFKVVIEPQYRPADDFHEGRAKVFLDKKAGFIDKTGRLVIPCQFDNARVFREGMAVIEMDKKYGYVDMSGNVIIPPRFDSAKDFSEGLAAVQENGYWGFIDKTGEFVF